MPKIDKSLYSKAEYKQLKYLKKQKKLQQKIQSPVSKDPSYSNKIAFVLGNGVSRKPIDPVVLKTYGKIYGCNAIYRTFSPDFLIAVDVKMILEISEFGYQKNHEVWTNPNRAYQGISNLNFFNPNKGWSSGPTALWLASQHTYDRIYILGFDYMGLKNGKRVNNIYADTKNYKKSTDGATFFGNWLRQTVLTVRQHSHIDYIRVVDQNAYHPREFKEYKNYHTLSIEKFLHLFSIEPK